MGRDREVVALLLGEGNQAAAEGSCAGAEYLVREADGKMSLEAVSSAEELERTARRTGCFKRGKPIFDPETREVIGYEMEPVTLARADAGPGNGAAASVLSPLSLSVAVAERLDVAHDAVLES